MFSFDELKERGFDAESILYNIEAMMDTDDIVYYLYNILKDNDCEIPTEIEEHYRNHCE